MYKEMNGITFQASRREKLDTMARAKGYKVSRGIISMWSVNCGWDIRPCNNLDEVSSVIRNLPNLN